MLLGVAAVVCIAVFVVCAFAVRLRMHRLTVAYETRMQAIAEIHADIDGLERELRSAAKTERVMRSNQLLFRTLWPIEYDRTLYAARHLIAQMNRELALSDQ